MGQFKARQSFLGTNRSVGPQSFVEPAGIKNSNGTAGNLKCDAYLRGFERIYARGKLCATAREMKTLIPGMWRYSLSFEIGGYHLLYHIHTFI